MLVNYGQSSDKEHEDRCVTCGKEVKEDNEVNQCDLWEHLTCIKVCDRPTNDHYHSHCVNQWYLCARSVEARVP